MGMVAPIYYTADMVRAMPDDGNRYEVVYGELLVTPAPRPWHQILVHRLSVALELYLREQPVGVVLSSPADISWGPDVLLQPDVFVVPTDEARTLTWSRMRTLLLVGERGSSARNATRQLDQLRVEGGEDRFERECIALAHTLHRQLLVTVRGEVDGSGGTRRR
jgi:hypothetical protein